MLPSPQATVVPRLEPPSERVADDSTPTVLVVDDYANGRAAARLVLQAAGYRVIEAATGMDAIHIAIARRPCAILLDMVLPGLDGWEIARRLRDHSATREIAIIALTALAAAGDHHRAILAGCDAVLTKPVAARTLVDIMHQHASLPRPTAPIGASTANRTFERGP